MFKTSNKIADIFLNILDINIFYTAYFLIINLNWTVSLIIVNQIVKTGKLVHQSEYSVL